MNSFYSTYPSLINQFKGAQPLRVMAVHESFHHFQMGVLLCFLQQFFRLSNSQCNGFFTQHMLACSKCFNGPWNMHVIWKRYVHCIYAGIIQQFLIRTI